MKEVYGMVKRAGYLDIQTMLSHAFLLTNPFIPIVPSSKAWHLLLIALVIISDPKSTITDWRECFTFPNQAFIDLSQPPGQCGVVAGKRS